MGVVDASGNSYGNGWLSGFTPWMRFFTVAGPIAVIAMYFVWWITGGQDQRLKAVEDALSSLSVSVSAASASNANFATAHAQDTQRLISLMRQLCVNTSKNSQQQLRCLEQ